MTGPHRHGPTRPLIPHHPSVGPAGDELERLLELADAQRTVADAAVAETAAEVRYRQATINALEAPHGSPAITEAANAVRAAAAARATRRAAVAALLALRNR